MDMDVMWINEVVLHRFRKEPKNLFVGLLECCICSMRVVRLLKSRVSISRLADNDKNLFSEHKHGGSENPFGPMEFNERH